MKANYLFFYAFFIFALGSCSAPKKIVNKTESKQEIVTAQNFKFAFYNVENLFDINDDPKTIDEEFLPEGKNKWTLERYKLKLNHTARVIAAMDFPVAMGFAEIENEGVMQDLVKEPALSAYPYKVVHYDSPDMRGIDVAFIYQEKYFKVLDSKPIRINFPKELDKKADAEPSLTRDILQVRGVLAGRDTIHYFVNHWPSRRGGQDESESRRLFVAAQLRQAVDALLAKNSKANIVIVGDLNDETDNKSVTDILKAKSPSDTPSSDALYDLMMPLDQAGQGSYKYKDTWNMLDHIIVSGNLSNSKSTIYVSGATIFKQDFMLYLDKKSGEMLPSHTYVGPKYYGGYSDHLPVLVNVTLK